MYRENKKGEFNVPVGRKSNGDLLPMSVDFDNLRNVHKTLQNVELACHSYEKCIDGINEGDFVYIDPPYIPLDTTSFTQYSKDDFGEKNHYQLENFCSAINERGGHFMLSNSDTELTREIYLKDGRYSYEFDVQRSIASMAKNRKKAQELIITNYKK